MNSNAKRYFLRETLLKQCFRWNNTIHSPGFEAIFHSPIVSFLDIWLCFVVISRTNKYLRIPHTKILMLSLSLLLSLVSFFPSHDLISYEWNESTEISRLNKLIKADNSQHTNYVYIKRSSCTFWADATIYWEWKRPANSSDFIKIVWVNVYIYICVYVCESRKVSKLYEYCFVWENLPTPPLCQLSWV